MKMPMKCLPVFLLLLSLAPSTHADERIREYLELRRLIGSERFEEAFERCKVLMDRYPDYLALYESLADLGLYKNALQESELIFLDKIRIGVGVPFALYGVASCRAIQKDYQTAVQLYLESIHQGADFPECFKDLAYSYERAFGLDEAISFLGRLSLRVPQNANYNYALALELWKRGDFDVVKSCLWKAVSLSPNEPKYYDALAVADLLSRYSSEKAKVVLLRRRLARERLDFASSQFLAASLVSSRISLGEYAEEDFILSDATREANEFGLMRWLGWNLQRTADINALKGEFEESTKFASRALGIAERIADTDLKLNCLRRLYYSHFELGRLDSALSCAETRLSCLTSDATHSAYLNGLSGLAQVYLAAGDSKLAQEYAIEALAEAELISCDPLTRVEIETTVGMVQENIGNHRSALKHHLLAKRALTLVSAPPYFVAVNCGNIGRLQLKDSLFADAERNLHRQLAISIRSRFPTELSNAHLNLGGYFLARGWVGRAERSYLKALKIAKRIKNILLEFEAQKGLADLMERKGDYRDALRLYTELVDVATRAMCCGKVYFPEFIAALKRKSNLEIQSGLLDDAFRTLEMAKAEEQHMCSWLGKKGARALLDGSSFDQYSKNLDQLVDRYAMLYAGKAGDAKLIESRRKELSLMSDMFHTLIQMRIAIAQARKKTRVHGASFLPSEYGIADVQRTILSDSACALEFMVGEEQTSIILIKRDTVQSFTVNVSRRMLEQAISSLSRAIAGANSSFPILHSSMASFHGQTSRTLYCWLIKPLEHHLIGITKMIIVPDGCLRNLPFEALVQDKPLLNHEDPFLILDYEISYCTTLNDLFRSIQRHEPPLPLLAFGNPEPPDRQEVQTYGVHGDLAWGSRKPRLLELRGARTELRSLREMYGNSCRLIDWDEATKQSFMEIAPNYRVIHLATHNKFDAEHLENSGLAFASCRGCEDAYLHVCEIRKLEMEASLVVLSGCNTGLSTMTSAGMDPASALLNAGVTSVVSTLWQVDDESSAELVLDFYRLLNSGCGVSCALRGAKLRAIMKGRSDPYYWAGYVLSGSPHALEGGGIANFKDDISEAVSDAGLLFVGLVGTLLIQRAIARRRTSIPPSDSIGSQSGYIRFMEAESRRELLETREGKSERKVPQ